MYKHLQIAVLLLGFGSALQAQNLSFIENRGQWAQDFDYKLSLSNSAVFLEGNNFTVHLSDINYSKLHKSGHQPEQAETEAEAIQHHAYRVHFVGASPGPKAIPSEKRKQYHNYILGNDPSRWKSQVGLYGEVLYEDIYPGIDLRYYFSAEGNLKYDLIVHPGADPTQVKIKYEGVDGLQLSYGHLMVKNSVEDVIESAPYSYQNIDGRKQKVESSFEVNEREVTLDLGRYDEKETLIIDPKLIFSSYSGSMANNFGYTATYSEDGGLYAGGIVYDDGNNYPISLGAYQKNPQGGDIDVGISKFSADGSTLLYSTYLGGSDNEMPYSLYETEDKSLLIFGSTGSIDFPVSGNAYSKTFQGGPVRSFYGGNISINYLYGSDAYITKLDSTGGSLLASTFFGGSGNEGFNTELNFNYGDYFRGEVIADSNKVFVVGSTHSGNLPTTAGAFQSSAGGGQDGFVASFDKNLSQLQWSGYVGGPAEDHALGLKRGLANQLYVAGGTESTALFPSDSPYRDSSAGGVEGYILSLNAGDGSFISATYNGTPERDVNYFVDVDYNGDVYVLGQTRGLYSVSDSVYANNGSAQYLHKFSPDLKRSLKATVIGDGSHDKSNFSPTAFMIDDCRNVYLSGWGGGNNITHYGQGTTHGLPITENADLKSTDGEDFYFMVMDASWKKLNYATYFGGDNDEHVDGGTSRFAKDGTIYQAVCAGCIGVSMFPTTPKAHARYNGSSGCNLAAIKMQIEAQECIAELESDQDSSCIPYTANLTNKSFNGDLYFWTLPDGSTAKGALPSLDITTKGKHHLQLIALDTTCGFTDTTTLELYGFEDSVYADFESDYDSCSNNFQVNFINASSTADSYYWDFGDGQTSNLPNPSHRYSKPGEYEVSLVTKNSFCQRTDTAYQSLKFKKRISSNEFHINYSPCANGTKAVFTAQGTAFQEYQWDFGDGGEATGKKVEHDFEKPGVYRVRLSLKDTLCQRYLQKDTSFTVYQSGYKPEMANVFTPNGDGANDFFGLPADLPESYTHSFSMKIYDRRGNEVYATHNINEPWDGRSQFEEVSEGVYFYILNYKDDCNHEKNYKGYVHLSK